MSSFIVRGICCFFFCCAAFASIAQKKSLRGIVTDKTNQQPVRNASIRNVISGNTIISKSDGSFIAEVAEGNILAFSANGYYTDTITITNNLMLSGRLTVLLNPLPSTLENVTVTSSHYYQTDSIERRRYFLQTVGEKKISAVGRANDLGFGIAVNLDHFGKTEKNKRRARSLFDITEEEAYINYRWNEVLVGKYTGFTNDELTSFIQKSRPSYTWLRKHTSEEDLVYYINSQLKKMRKA